MKRSKRLKLIEQFKKNINPQNPWRLMGEKLRGRYKYNAAKATEKGLVGSVYGVTIVEVSREAEQSIK